MALFQVYFTPIRTWLHREPEFATYFYEITTSNGKKLVLTAKHLVFREKCFGESL